MLNLRDTYEPIARAVLHIEHEFRGEKLGFHGSDFVKRVRARGQPPGVNCLRPQYSLLDERIDGGDARGLSSSIPSRFHGDSRQNFTTQCSFVFKGMDSASEC